MKRNVDRNSFFTRLLFAFVLTSVIPIMVVNIFSYYNSSSIVRKNFEDLTNVNLEQTKNSINISLESYEDILYQVYTDDEIVELVGKINAGEEVSFVRNQLRRKLRSLFYTKEYLQSITIIPKHGDIIFYDQITASNTENSWMDNYPLTLDTLYKDISSDSFTHLYPTHYASTFSSDDYYLFHVGHRIINYKDVDKQYGIVIISIDETLLKEICIADQNDMSDNNISFNFIIDNDGRIISYPDNQYLSKQLSMKPDVNEEDVYLEFLYSTNVFDDGNAIVNVLHDEMNHWHIVNVANKSKLFELLNLQRDVLFITIILSISAIIVVIVLQAKHLTSSIRKVVNVMNSAIHDEMSSRVDVNVDMPSEIKTIAVNFNEMMDRLEDSFDKVKRASDLQRDAEINALEAQINPHFLYNSLDTVNWMAIDREEYEISNAINALATFLRYGLDNSNGIVTIKDEIDWLEKYLAFQKNRLMDSFSSKIVVEDEVLSFRIYKLLLQPFVENAIIHGFKNHNSENQLVIHIRKDAKYLLVEIKDNGCGIEQTLVEDINKGIFRESSNNNIGMKNAISRIKMYYGENAKVKVQSTIGRGTHIQLEIPIKN